MRFLKTSTLELIVLDFLCLRFQSPIVPRGDLGLILVWEKKTSNPLKTRHSCFKQCKNAPHIVYLLSNSPVLSTLGDFAQIFCPLRAKSSARAVPSAFSIFSGSFNASLITFPRLSPNRFYNTLKFWIYQKLAKIAKILIFRAPLSLFRDKLWLR